MSRRLADYANRRAMHRIFVAIIAVLAAAADPAAAWNNQGHMATGAIAYDALAALDPATAAAIEALMAQHPDKARFDKALTGLTGVARRRRLFEQMARWPDDIRKTDYDHPEWHYGAKVISGWTLFGAITVGSAEAEFARNMAVARDRNASAADRAVALCWIFHIVGDMHEPLHAGHAQNWTFPLTDRLGTIAWVRTATAVPPITMHEYWDGAVDFPGDETAAAGRVSAEITRLYPRPASLALGAAPTAAFARWVGESRQLAIDVVYKGAALEFDAGQRQGAGACRRLSGGCAQPRLPPRQRRRPPHRRGDGGTSPQRRGMKPLHIAPISTGLTAPAMDLLTVRWPTSNSPFISFGGDWA